MRLIDADEIVKKLRTESLYAHKANLEIMDLCMESASLIESLQAQLVDAQTRNKRLVIAYGAYDGSALERADDLIESMEEEIKALKEKIAASQRRADAAVEDLNGTGACFTCKHFRRNGGDCFGAGRCRLDGIEIWPCNEPGVYRVEVPDDGRKTYEWRGPQEAGNGGAE